MSFDLSQYLHELEQVQGNLCVCCGFITQLQKADGYHCCCEGCCDGTGCTCDPVDAVAATQAAVVAATPPPLVAVGSRPRLACQSCELFVANTDGGFESCCQACMYGTCTCTDADRVDATTITNLAHFHDAEAAWSDADHAQMVQDNSTPAPTAHHKKLTKEQVKRRFKRYADDSTGFCAICQFADTDPAGKLLCCGQRFHVDCIQTWLTGHKAICPTCNRQQF